MMMMGGSSSASSKARAFRRLAAAAACAVAPLCVSVDGTAAAIGTRGGQSERASAILVHAFTAGSPSPSPGASSPAPSASVALEQCASAAAQGERSATFSGEMTAISDSARMTMRIDIQVLMPGEALYRTLSAPGLGVWRTADPGVKSYRYLKQVTNLLAPASYRAVVRFRWLNGKGRLLKSAYRRTPGCEQTVIASPPPGGSTTTGGSSAPPG